MLKSGIPVLFLPEEKILYNVRFNAEAFKGIYVSEGFRFEGRYLAACFANPFVVFSLLFNKSVRNKEENGSACAADNGHDGIEVNNNCKSGKNREKLDDGVWKPTDGTACNLLNVRLEAVKKVARGIFSDSHPILPFSDIHPKYVLTSCRFQVMKIRKKSKGKKD